MAIHIPYDVRLPYLSIPNLGLQPAIELTLHAGIRAAKVIGILDSGSTVTTFSEDVATRLGIADIREGALMRASTLAGNLDVYLFDLEMSIDVGKFSTRFPARVAFRHGLQSRNLLGRNIVFAHFHIGFNEDRQEIYLKS